MTTDPHDAVTADPHDHPGGIYTSSACTHRDHTYCNSKVGITGPKVRGAGMCKYCGLICTCPCHGEPQNDDAADQPIRTPPATAAALIALGWTPPPDQPTT